MNNLIKYREYVDSILDDFLSRPVGNFKKLHEAMRYSVKQEGKRIRPILMKLSYEAVGGQGNIDAYMSAIEFIHTYSLIHDDLPAMDNDDLRRGQPTNHKKFDEATAILAGDGLLSLAFQIMLEDIAQNEDIARIRAANILSEGAGVTGMVAGQILDMESEDTEVDLPTLELIHIHKTGALLKSATKMGAVLGYGSQTEISALETYGQYIGKVFQIIDDVLDITSSTTELGKPINSDATNKKMTYTNYYSIQECYNIANDLTNKAIRCLDKVSGDTTLLRNIALDLAKRKN